MKDWPKRGIKVTEGPFAGQTIHMGEQDEIDKYDERLQAMLTDCFGIGGALLTDLSTLSDFMPDNDDMEKLRTNYDSEAKIGDRLVDIAKRIWK